MKPQQQVKDLFADALEQPAEQREAFLETACHGDAMLLELVRAMLRAHDQAGAFLSSPTQPDVPFPDTRTAKNNKPAEGPGTVIGNYKLLQEIGHGGFGVVYMAEQERPVRRKVALKIIKLGMDTKQVIARFEAERQALAMMDHPNIAKVLDAGATDTGRPYFVMELVRGVPVTEYCDTDKLNTHSRLELFMQICHAVQHAHTKGIIHRDIKPSNVMITMHDGAPVPKVIDFGIAKAIHQRLTDKTLFTEYKQFIGTPEYMSPEQAEMSGLDIDTRSDIYSLGVLLYELLTGTTPFDGRRLRSAAIDELQRIICEEEPDKPSTRLSSLQSEPRPLGSGLPESGAPALRERTSRATKASPAFDRLPLPHGRVSDSSSVQDIARHRRTDPRSLAKQLRGDLDWVVMKCLEKERARRYETANDLAADLQRHLSDEPVEASPPSARYRFRKFARRNKRLLGSITGIAAALIIGLTLATYGFITASNERDEKETALTKEQQARAESEQARAESDAVTKFLSDMLGAVNPGKEGRDVSVREVLDKASKKIGEEFADQPEVEAALRTTIGETYYALGLYDEAEPHLSTALATYERLHGDEHPKVAALLHQLNRLYQAKGDYAEAERVGRRGLNLARKLLGDEHADVAVSLNGLAILMQRKGDFAEAERLYLQGLDVARKLVGEQASVGLSLTNNLANLYRAQGRYDAAEPMYRQVLESLRREFGEEHPNTLTVKNNVGLTLMQRSRYDEAADLHRSVLDTRKRVLGDTHPDTLQSMHNLALARIMQRRRAEGEALLLESLEIHKQTLGAENPATLHSMAFVAIMYYSWQRFEEAEPRLKDVLESRRHVLGDEHPDTLTSMLHLGTLYAALGRVDDAEGLVEPALPVMRRVMGPRSKFTRNAMATLGDVYIRQGRFADAEPLLRERLALEITVHDEEHSRAAWARGALGEMLVWEGRIDEAAKLARDNLSRQLAAPEAGGGEAPTFNFAAWMMLEIAPPEQHDAQKALDWALRANKYTRSSHPGYLLTLALAYHLTGDTARALETQQEALSLLTEDQESYRPEMEANLAKYKAALEQNAEDDR